jgi:hypothetical protein
LAPANRKGIIAFSRPRPSKLSRGLEDLNGLSCGQRHTGETRMD